jgi:nucleoside-diphosphate-sugar epimerase
MQVLLTGGTGFIGSAVLAELVSSGHSVTALVRSDSSARAVSDAGATALVGDITDSAWLADQLRDVDGAIHTAVPSEGSAAAFDDAVIDAAIAAFSGTDKPFIYTTGVWIYGAGDNITESSSIDAPAITSWREARQVRLLAGGIAARVIAPGIVYGQGKGIPNVISSAPRNADGALTLVGTGDQHWTTVNVDDLARLYAVVLDRGADGEVYLGVSGDNPTVRQLAQAVVGAAGAVASDDLDATRARLGAEFADALFIDQQATGAKARSLGWTPTARSLADDFSAGT